MLKKSTIQVKKNHAHDKYHDTFNFPFTDRMINSCCMGFVAYNDHPYMYTGGLFSNSFSIICEFYVKHFVFHCEAALAVAAFGRSSKSTETSKCKSFVVHNPNARAQLILQNFSNLCQDGTNAPGVQILC
jgi:hypothetical protein